MKKWLIGTALALSAAELIAGTTFLQSGHGKINMAKFGAYATDATMRYMTPKPSTDAQKKWTIGTIENTATNFSKVTVVSDTGIAQQAPASGYTKGTYYLHVASGLKAQSGKTLKQSTINLFTIY